MRICVPATTWHRNVTRMHQDCCIARSDVTTVLQQAWGSAHDSAKKLRRWAVETRAAEAISPEVQVDGTRTAHAVCRRFHGIRSILTLDVRQD